MLEDNVGARPHVKTGGDHRRSMDQCGNWSWTSHGVGQPHVQWQLCRLTAGAQKKSERNPRENAPVTEQFNRKRFGLFENFGVLRGSEGGDYAKDCECESKVSDAVRDERLP